MTAPTLGGVVGNALTAHRQPPGGCLDATISVTATVDPATADGATISNTATVSSSDDRPDTRQQQRHRDHHGGYAAPTSASPRATAPIR